MEVFLRSEGTKEKSFSAEVSMEGSGNLECWDTFTGDMYSIPVEQKNSRITARIFFPATGSRLLVKCGVKSEAPAIGLSAPEISQIKQMPDNWNFRRIDKNSFTLDICRYKLENNSRWSNLLPVISLQSELEKADRRQKVSLRFFFDTDFNHKPEELSLVLEQPGIFRIKINGHRLEYEDTGWWVDTSFKKVDITGYVELKGKNVIELECTFIPPRKTNTLIFKENGVELESIYLAGDFTVKGSFKKAKDGYYGKNFELADEKNAVKPDDLVSSGYPFFAGSVNFSQEVEINKKTGEKIFLKIAGFKATIAKITVNGKEAGFIFLPPHELDITGYLRDGNNSVEIEITNTLRNLLGPHHYKIICPEHTRAETFAKNKGLWTDRYTFVPFGLGKIQLIRKR